MIVGFSGLAWITPYYASLGMPVADAARLFAYFQIVQLVAMLSLPTITDFTRDRRPPGGQRRGHGGGGPDHGRRADAVGAAGNRALRVRGRRRLGAGAGPGLGLHV